MKGNEVVSEAGDLAVLGKCQLGDGNGLSRGVCPPLSSSHSPEEDD